MINQEIIKSYGSFEKDFKELDRIKEDYKKRFYKRLISKGKKPERLLGQNGVTFLLHSLTRSNCLFAGFIDCINLKHRTLSFLAVRSHLETTASVAYFLKNLRKFYDNKIDYKYIDKILFKLSLGGRTFPDKKKHPHFPEAINILTLIEGADKFFTKYGSKTETPFREAYDFLSEFCHPNMLGLTIGSEIEELGVVEYYERPNFREEDFGTLLNLLIMSCDFLFHVYDESFSLLKSNEEIPNLKK